MDRLRLAPRSPLDEMAAPDSAGLTVESSAPVLRFIFRGDDSARSACSDAFGVTLPPTLGLVGEKDERVALWLGPDEWLLTSGDGDPDLFPQTIASRLAAIPYSLVDVTHRQVGLTIRGERSSRVLSAGCPMDLRLRAFPVGFATRTIFDKAEVVLWRQGPDKFHVEVWRSFAPYVVSALLEASRDKPNRQ